MGAVQACTEVAPTIIGKPELALLEMAMDQMHARRSTTGALGDRLETDIAGAIKAGMASIFVLTGISTRQDLERSPFQPTFVYAGLPDLMAAWEGGA